MKLELRARGVRMTSRLRKHVERRLESALARFRDRVRYVRVQLTDVNGPRGGDDIECSVRARLDAGGELVIQDTGRDSFTSVARAARRVRLNLARRIQRRRSGRRRRR